MRVETTQATVHKKGPLRKGIGINDAKGRFSFSLIVNCQ